MHRAHHLSSFPQIAAWCVLLAFAASFLLVSPAVAQSDFQVIVHKDNPKTEFTKKDLDKIFLKRDKTWDHGPTIEPVNLPDDSKTRDQFSEEIHGRSTSSIESYWQRQIFSGRGVPPEELDDDDAVIAFVTANPGGIGYVGSGTKLPDTVKAITITGDK